MNARVCCSLIAVLLCLSVCLSTKDAQKCAIEKPGSCPKPTGVGLCAEMCSGDGSCPNNQKCCSNGCGHQCMDPYQAVKPGSCPKPVGAGLCVEKCSGDGSCPNNQKCCSNGCGHQCMAPCTGGMLC
ncbi:WAP four-disulfide core domain protein 18-like [Carassius auratus]|uniref:WAP four-disulfide core domain protein 18-like n=1 Tax=Carassius auratus TaxID=7957 RepID=A0A6P6PEY0_CARAU|nr:WAP four-disulfide core domain protein 18-like [Carassius auratus]